jgi:DNA-binding response OmpR family regulator
MGDKILVVDDSRPFRQSLVRFLAMEGFDVIEADDGLSALEEYQKARPDLVVMDINMPRLDGFETVRRLREFSVVPVLILSCRNAEMDRVLGLNSGADFYLAKPFSASELLVRVQSLLRRYRRQNRPRKADAVPA